MLEEMVPSIGNNSVLIAFLLQRIFLIQEKSETQILRQKKNTYREHNSLVGNLEQCGCHSESESTCSQCMVVIL